MKKLFCLLLVLLLVLTGCAKPAENPEPETETAAPMVSLYDLRKAMLDAQPGLPEMSAVSSSDENAAELFTYLSELDYEKVEGYYLAYAADGKTANEFAVVCLKDAADLPALTTTLKAHVQGRVNLYKTYAPELVEQASAAEIVTVGRYAALIMCEDRAAVKAAFLAGVR